MSKSRVKCSTDAEIATLQRRYRYILTQGKSELPPIPDKPGGKRGKIAKSDADNLLERMQRYEKAVLLFAKDANIPFTNNRAERDFRMSKVKQKISGCFVPSNMHRLIVEYPVTLTVTILFLLFKWRLMATLFLIGVSSYLSCRYVDNFSAVRSSCLWRIILN